MKIRVAWVFAVVVLAVLSSQSQVVWLQDTFHRSAPGSQWVSQTSEWKIVHDTLQCDTRGYDQLLASRFYVNGTTPYSLEVVIKGARAGIYFSLDDTTSKVFSHMVRFDDSSILTGYFNGAGEYRATNTFESPADPRGWVKLRIDVNPSRHRYGVFVNGTLLGIDSSLVYRSGYVGLQASDGVSQFASFRVFSATRQRSPVKVKKGDVVSFQHVRSVKSVGTRVVLYNPETKRLQTIDRNGRLVRENAVRKVPTLPTVARIGIFRCTIEGKKVMMRNSAGVAVDSLTDRIAAPTSIISGTLDGKTVLYVTDPGTNSVQLYDDHLQLLRIFDAASIGGRHLSKEVSIE